MSVRQKYWNDHKLPEFPLWWKGPSKDRSRKADRKRLICAACGELFSLRSLPEHIRKTHMHRKCLLIAKCVDAECMETRKYPDMYSATFITDHLTDEKNTHEIIVANKICKHRLSCQQLFDDIFELSIGMGFVNSNYEQWGSTELREELRKGIEFYHTKRKHITRNWQTDDKACFVQDYEDDAEASDGINKISTTFNGRSSDSPGGTPSSPGRTPAYYDCRSPAYARSPAASRSNSRASSPFGNDPDVDFSSNPISAGGRSPGYDEFNTRMGEHHFMMDEEEDPVPSKKSSMINAISLKVKEEPADEDPNNELAGGRPSMPFQPSYTPTLPAAYSAYSASPVSSHSMQAPSTSHSSAVARKPSYSAIHQPSLSSPLPPPRLIQSSSSVPKRISRFDQPPAYHSSDTIQNGGNPGRHSSTYENTPTPPTIRKPSYVHDYPPQPQQPYRPPAPSRPPSQTFYPSRDRPYNGDSHPYEMTSSNRGMNYASNFENGAPFASQQHFDQYSNNRSSSNSYNYNIRETISRTASNSERIRNVPSRSHHESKPPLNNSLFSDEADKYNGDRKRRRC